MSEYKGKGYSARGEFGDTPEKFKALLLAWSQSARKFVEDMIKPPRISVQQGMGLDAISNLVNAKIKFAERPTECSLDECVLAHKKGISIMSGHGTGKDTFASWVIWWFLFCFPSPKIPCTAPTQHQLRDVLWSELSKWLRLSRNRANTKRSNQHTQGSYSMLDQFFTMQSDKIFYTEQGGKEWYAIARTVNAKASAEDQAETLAGLHEDYMMFVVDEASGVPNPVFKPIEGSMTGKCNFAVIIFNPTRASGFAYETHFKERKNWECLRWNAEESENVDQTHIEYMRNKYGKDSNTYRVRVLGLPPKSESDMFIPWDWVQNAIKRENVELDPNEAMVAALDVGGGGDESVYLRRQGGIVFPGIAQQNNPDTMYTANWALDFASDDDLEFLFVDIVGIGRGVHDRMKQIGSGRTKVVGVNNSNSARDESKYDRVREECWGRMRQAFEEGWISIPDDDELISGLTNIKYDESSGKIKLEKKSQMKLRGVPSPNKADALAMTFYFKDKMTKKSKETPMQEYRRGATRQQKWPSKGRKRQWLLS